MKVTVNTTSWSKARQARAKAAKMPVVGKDLSEDAPMMFVRVANGQQIIVFPKFGTWGIGFENADDGNTNLPWETEAAEILDHIRSSSSVPIDDAECLAAIELLQQCLPWVLAEYGQPITHDPRLETVHRYRHTGGRPA